MEPGARGSAELSGVRSRWSVLDRFARLSCLFWLLAVAWLAGASAAAPGIAAVPTSPLVLQVYVQDGCPHCAAAKRFVERLQRERPALRVEYRVVDQDPLAARTLHELALANGVWPPGVPAFAVDSRLLAIDVYKRQVLTLMSQSSPGDWESGPGQAVVRSLIFHRTGRKST